VQKKAKTEDSIVSGDSGKATSKDGKTTFPLPKGSSWEEEINEIQIIQHAPDGSGALLATVAWRDGNVSQHQLKVLYARCPQRMLRYYESHL
jgi:chromobox protein 1